MNALGQELMVQSIPLSESKEVKAGMNVGQTPEFSEWEDRHLYKQGIFNENLYLQGMKDGIQLAVVLQSYFDWADDESADDNHP